MIVFVFEILGLVATGVVVVAGALAVPFCMAALSRHAQLADAETSLRVARLRALGTRELDKQLALPRGSE